MNFSKGKYVFLLFLFLAQLGIAPVAAEGIDFFKGTFQEALAKAKEEGKPIFVDAYAVWCGPCKRMAKTVFTDAAVGEFYNANFVNMKLDMERGEGAKFRQAYPVSAFPTLFYIDASGEVMHKQKGAQPVDGFIALGKKVLNKVDHSKGMETEYEEGKRDPDFILAYVTALNKSNKSSLKVANKYLTKKKDYKNPTNLKIIYEATTQADSRIFDLLITHKKAIEKIYAKEDVENKIEQACRATVITSIDFESEDLLRDAQEKMKKHLPKKSSLFLLQSEMDFCVAMGNAEKYVKCCNDYVKKEIKDDDKRLHGLAQEIVKHFSKDQKAMRQAEKLAKKALDSDEEVLEYHLTYATILNKNGKKSEALKVAQSSMGLAEKSGQEKFVRKLIQIIEG